MSKGNRILESWVERRPTEVRVRDVEVVLEEYFPGAWEWKKSSHIIVRCDILDINPKFRLGLITIPTVSGRIVKGVYVAEIIKAIDFIKQYEVWKSGKKS